jgi:hypothetical protein
VPRRDPVVAVRRICLALPEVSERLSHGAPTFFVRDKKTLATVWNDHHGDGRVGLICAAPPGVQQQLVDEEPKRVSMFPRTSGTEAGSVSDSTWRSIGTRSGRSSAMRIGASRLRS